MKPEISQSTFLTNLIHFPTILTCSLLNILNIRTYSTQITPLDQTTKRQTAFVQFHKSNRTKQEFVGSLTFFCSENSSTKKSNATKTVAYGQWHNIHDTNSLNYEFVIYKN